MNEPDVLGNAGPRFERDLQCEDFENYLMFTYGIDSELLARFDSSDTVVVCGPSDTASEVESVDVEATVNTRTVQSHAKLYLMWGADQIVCWFGSFNFTYPGIYNNVEWAARFSGSVETNPAPMDMVEGKLPERVTESWQIQQAIELVGSTFTGTDTESADALLQNTDYPYVLVHSHRSNTLKRALQNELTDATGTVSLTYYSPFVNTRGIELFIETLKPAIRPEDVELTVRTCRLDRIRDQDTGLTSAHVSSFEKRFAEFEYLVRAPGDQGDHLRDGRELRSGFAHHKTVRLTYRDSAGEPQRVTLLTTANLTKNPWQRRSGNFEIGLLLRDHERNEQLHELLGPQLSHCYEQPREHELDEATESSSERASFEDVWLEDLVRERLQLATDRLELPWDPNLPSLDSVAATLYYRDILDGIRAPETVSLEKSPTGFSAAIPALADQHDKVIDFIELDFRTSFSPPERRLTDVGIDRVNDGELSLTGIRETTAICDGTSIPVESLLGSPITADKVWLRAETPLSREIKLVHEPTEQPHLEAEFVQSVTTGAVSSDRIGGATYIDVTVDPAITPKHDQLVMREPCGRVVEYLGFGHPDQDTIRYYLDARHGGKKIETTVAPPLDRYYRPQALSEQLPSPAEPTAKSVRHFVGSELSAHPAGTASVIDNETPIQFRSNIEGLPSTVPVTVQWGLRGYDRFGGSLRIDETLPPQEPHRQIWFQGAVSLDIEGTESVLLTRRNSVTVKEQPFIEHLRIREDLLPTRLDLRSLSNHQILSWVIVDRKDVLKPAVRDTEQHLYVSVQQSGKACKRVCCPVLDGEELLCFPLMGYYRDTAVTLEYNLELRGGRPEISYYASRQLQLQIEIHASEDTIELIWEDGAHSIHHAEGASDSTIDELTDRVDVDELSSYLLPQDPFELRSRSRVDLLIRKPGLLHLTSKDS